MKTQRQAKILDIIESVDVETQESLLEELKNAGFNSTQATISRDIKELRLVKELAPSGKYRYTVSIKEPNGGFNTKFNTIFKESVTSYDYAQNLVVIKTLPGLASAACAAIDAMEIPQIIGTIAGDDTFMLAMKDTAAAILFCSEIKKMIS